MPASSLTMLAMGLQAGESMLSKDLLPSGAEFTMSAWVDSLGCFFGLFLRLGTSAMTSSSNILSKD